MASGVDVGAGVVASFFFLFRIETKDSSRDCYVVSVRTVVYKAHLKVHVCWSEHSDSSFVYGFMILDYGFGTMTATT